MCICCAIRVGYPRYSGVRSEMAVQLDLPLLELAVESFSRAWTQFELVAAATLGRDKAGTHPANPLRGKLPDYYVELDTDQKGSLRVLKAALMTKAAFRKILWQLDVPSAPGTKVPRRE